MNIHVTGHALFARQGAPVLNRGGGDRDDNLLPLPVMNWDDEKPTNNCGCNGHSTARETEADIDKQFDRATAIAQNMSMVSNGTRDVLPLPRLFGPPPSGGIRLGGGEPTVNGGYSLFGGAGNAPVMNRGGDDDSPLPLPVMTWD